MSYDSKWTTVYVDSPGGAIVSGSSSGHASKASLVGLLLALGLSGILVLTTACTDLSSDSSTTQSTTTTTTEPGDDSTGVADDGGSRDGDGGSDDPGDDPGDDPADEPGGDDPGGDDDGTGADDLLPDGPIGTAFFFPPTTEDRSIGDWWEFDNSDNNIGVTIPRRDVIRVTLDFPRTEQVTYTGWDLGGDRGTIGNIGYDETRTLLGRYITRVEYEFIATEAGSSRLMITSYHERDREYHMWRIIVEVTE